MSSNLKASLLAASICAGVAATSQAAQLPNHVPNFVANAQKVGGVNAAARVSVIVYLKVRDEAALRQLIADVSTPSSPSYGKYLTPDQFKARFAPSASDVAAVKSFLTGAGIQVVRVARSGLYIEGSATIGQLAKTFQIAEYSYRYNGRLVRANANAPTVPDALASKIVFIDGLDEASALKHPMHASLGGALRAPARRPAALRPDATTVTPPPTAAALPSPYCSTYWGDTVGTLSNAAAPFGTSLPWLVCGYTPQQMRAAYGLDKVTLLGQGVRVAIVDAYASPTLMQDGNEYAINHSLPPLTAANFRQIIPAGIYGVSPSETCGPYGWWGEESLDVAAVHSAAPGATITYVGSRDCGNSLDRALFDTIDAGLADVITNSWSFSGEPATGSYFAAVDQYLMQASALGISVLFSSGDSGDVASSLGVASGSYPGTSPWVTAVGGTTLGLGPNNGNKQEWGWGTWRAYLLNATVNSASSVTTDGVGAFDASNDPYTFYSGAGGGPSLWEVQPTFQASKVGTNLSSFTYAYPSGETIPLAVPRRVVPDVAMLADPYTGMLYGETFTIAGNPVADAGCTANSDGVTEYCEQPIGGTSLASPLFAGVLAVVNQARFAKGKPAVGFANPWLYTLTVGGTGTRKSPLVDVLPPKTPTALLRGYANNLNRVRVVSVNGFPNATCRKGFCSGADSWSLSTAGGYDNVTGLGTVWVPQLATQ